MAHHSSKACVRNAIVIMSIVRTMLDERIHFRVSSMRFVEENLSYLFRSGYYSTANLLTNDRRAEQEDIVDSSHDDDDTTTILSDQVVQSPVEQEMDLSASSLLTHIVSDSTSAVDNSRNIDIPIPNESDAASAAIISSSLGTSNDGQ
jgi:hypothetical protein